MTKKVVLNDDDANNKSKRKPSLTGCCTGDRAIVGCGIFNAHRWRGPGEQIR